MNYSVTEGPKSQNPPVVGFMPLISQITITEQQIQQPRSEATPQVFTSETSQDKSYRLVDSNHDIQQVEGPQKLPMQHSV